MNEGGIDAKGRCLFDSFTAPSTCVVRDKMGSEILPIFVNQMEIKAIQSLIGRDPDFLAAIGRLVAHIFQDGTVFYRGPNHVMNDSISRKLQKHFQDHAYHMLVDGILFGLTLYAIEPDDRVGGLPRHIPLDQAYVGFIADEYADPVYHVWFRGVPRSDIKVMVSRAPHENGRINTAMAAVLEIKRMSVMFDRALLRSTASRLNPAAVIQTRVASTPVALPPATMNRIADALGASPSDLMLLNGGQTSQAIHSRVSADPFLDIRRSHGSVTSFDDNLRQVIADSELGDNPRIVPVDGSDRVFISAGDGQEMHPLPPALPPQYYPLVEERMAGYIAKILGYPKELWAGTASTYKKDLNALAQLGDRTARFHAQDIEAKFNQFSEEIWHLRDESSVVADADGADADADDTGPIVERASAQHRADKEKKKIPGAAPGAAKTAAPGTAKAVAQETAKAEGSKKAGSAKKRKRQHAPDSDTDLEYSQETADPATQLPVIGSAIEEVEPFLLSAFSYRDLNVRVKIGFVVRKELQERAGLASAFGIRQALPWMDTEALPVIRRGGAASTGKGQRSSSALDDMFFEVAPRRGAVRGLVRDSVSAKVYLPDNGGSKGGGGDKPKPRPLNPAKRKRKVTADPDEEDERADDEEKNNAGDDNSQLNNSDY